MARLIVKNLPKFITEQKLKEEFQKIGEVTDVQLKQTYEGKSRNFGFVGYRRLADAERAKERYHNAFLYSKKIQVTDAHTPGDPDKPESWSKYAARNKLEKWKRVDIDVQAENISKPEDEVSKDEEAPENQFAELMESDPKFKEFLEAKADKESKGMLLAWSNERIDTSKMAQRQTKKKNKKKGADESDQESESEGEQVEEIIPDPEEPSTSSPSKKKKNKKSKKKDDDDLPLDEDGNEVVQKRRFVLRLTRVLNHAKKKDILEFFGKEFKPQQVWVSEKFKGVAYAEFSTEKEMREALFKDKSFMQFNQVRVTVMESKTDEKNEKEDESAKAHEEKMAKWAKQDEETAAAEETIAESGCLFARNLPYSTTEDELTELFAQFGPISDLQLPVDRVTKQIKGFAIIVYMMPEHAVIAYSKLDRTIFGGRLLHILPGKQREDPLQAEEGAGYKEQKLAKLKQQSSSSHNWNTLFIGENAVAELMAQKFNVEKREILNSQDSKESAAVRLALGETQFVMEMKTFLMDNGVMLDSFRPNYKRSKTVILAKDLPANTETEEIKQLFSKFGEVQKCLLPPSGVTALVEFSNGTDAKTAFKKLAYSNFHFQPLYLEWAPIDVFQGAVKKKKDKKTEGGEEEEPMSDDEDVNPEADTTLFVKNINLVTSDEDFTVFFQQFGPLQYARITRKRDVKDPSLFVSLGCGFVQFKYQKDAKTALKRAMEKQLDGYALELKQSNRTLENDVKTARKQSKETKQKSAKIHVKNIPFQATQEEIKQLFSPYGELKGVRLPMKFGAGYRGGHRGFGFVEFESRKDAKRAFEAIGASTHLYGRHLVLEWADSGDDVDRLRKREAERYQTGGPKPKRVKTNVLDDLLKMSTTAKDQDE